MAVELMNLSQVTTALITGEYPSQWAYNLQQLTYKSLTLDEFVSEVERVTDGYVTAHKARSGNVLGYTVKGYPQVSLPSFVDSNTTSIVRGTISAPVETNVVSAGSTAVKTSRLTGVGTKVATAASKLAIPLTLASIGVTLGKTIDEIAYNANPDFWNSIGMETVNPQTWSSLVGGDGTVAGSFFNAIFGIDPATGETQAYIDADAMAYAAYCMQLSGFFSDTGYSPTSVDNLYNPEAFSLPIQAANTPPFIVGTANNVSKQINITSSTDTVCCALIYCNGLGYTPVVSKKSFTVSSNAISSNYRNYTATKSYTRAGHDVYYWNPNLSSVSATGRNIPVINYANSATYVSADFAEVVLYGNETSAIPGIGTQTGATTPNLNGLSESQVLPYLQQTYPDMFNDAISYDVVQPDGSIDTKTYVPITLPDTSQVTGTQPVSGDQTQADPSINPDTASQTLIDLLTKLLQQPDEGEATDDITPPENPVDTGEGSSPVPIVPVGSASSLWKIYHPTQAQIDSFGGWLWSSNFIDQILKIFNNPMEAVIGLHKVYATPVDAGATTIKVGYLDSEVPSNYIEQQYITVSCGSVNLYEQYGNVFDYSPYTDVQLYLPFIGIVPLNISDVMRSSISIEYGVDVITGACLAQVEVSRDGNSSVLYQYSGNCAVQYPISSGSYMGIVTSIISVAGGIAATAASGGAAAPLALGAVGGMMGAHTSVQRSGDFSGNAGAMGGKIPYLIITRPQTKVAPNAESMQGYPTNDYITVGECTGYIKAEIAHIININATDEELTEINELLMSGIII